MEQLRSRAEQVEAEMQFAFGYVRIVRRSWDKPIDQFGVANEHHVELATMPAPNAHAGFPDYWGPDRFERLGDVFLLPANYVVHARSECRQQHSIACSFLPEVTSAWFGDEIKWTDGRLQAVLNIPSPSIRGALFRLGEELRNPGFAGAAMVEMMAGQLAIELARYCMDVEERRPSGGLASWRLRLIDERLAEDGAPPTLTELASLCGLSVRQLTRAFRISRCRSIGDYIAEYRIDHAKRLLASGLCVKSIAYAKGFSSASAFATAFRRATGETPRQYRQRARRVRLRH